MSKNEIKNYGKSIRTKLLSVAKKEDVFYQTVLTRYFQERLLYRMSKTKYRSNFYLKGGALMYAYERFAARPTPQMSETMTETCRRRNSLSVSRKYSISSKNLRQ